MIIKYVQAMQQSKDLLACAFFWFVLTSQTTATEDAGPFPEGRKIFAETQAGGYIGPRAILGCCAPITQDIDLTNIDGPHATSGFFPYF